LFKSKGSITALNYGPYDNGHILVGLSTGDFFAFNSLTLQKLCGAKLGNQPISKIALEWTSLVLVAQGQKVHALSFIEIKQKYVYVELGTKRFATVVID
jgi:outer membrane protein assembly factor BamB